MSTRPPRQRAPEVFQMEVGLLQNFCEILSCPSTREAAIVDPAWEVDLLMREVRKRDLRVTKILITHSHNDHIEGVAEVAKLTGATIVMNEREVSRVRATLAGQDASFDFVVDGQTITVGACEVTALDTPGHTVGATCFLADGYVITGDVLFVGGCGRTNFPGGSTRDMWNSLQRLCALPEETRIYPGHNYGSTATSTIGRELLENPYLLCKTFEEFQRLRERK